MPRRYLKHIYASLPARVAGIVFWGMVVLGLGAAVVIIDLEEREQANRITLSTYMLVDLIDEILVKNATPPILENNRNLLDRQIKALSKHYGFTAVTLDYKQETLNIGQVSDGLTPFKRQHYLAGGTPENSGYLSLTVYFPNQEQALFDLRKNVFMVVGLLVMLFGTTLKYIFDWILSRPIHNMVATADQLTSGHTDLRFDEQRMDEFGHLAKFINQALDAVVSHQRELVSSREALAEEKERIEVVLDSITDAVIATDVNGHIQFMNPVAEHLMGWSNQEAMGRRLDEVVQLVHESTSDPLVSPIRKTLETGRTERIGSHGALIRHTGETIAVEAVSAPMRDSANHIIGVVLVLQDVSENRVLTRQLSHQASHDALTGLYNRPKFEEELQRLLDETMARGGEHVICYLDLDQFKVVNDTCGHMAGDELLRQLSKQMKTALRDKDILARIGGDEFGILFVDCSLGEARNTAERIRELVKEFSFVWGRKTFQIGVSIGVVVMDEHTASLAELLSAADLACYTAKDMGRNRIHVYEPSDKEMSQRHGEMRWATSLVQAMQENRFMLYRQPILGLQKDTKQTDHWEVLLRLRDPYGHIVKPDDFIGAAERYDLMNQIDRWVVRTTFETLADENLWPRNDNLPRRIGINLSGASLGDEGLSDYIRDLCQEFSLSLDEICFEITETVAISNLAQANKFINEMRNLGSHFALDDFGSGLSSFGYLKNLPVDYIKIDGGFVVDMLSDSVDRALVDSIVSIGHIMDVRVIAEWVEDQPTMDELVRLGVDYAQGHHVGQPVLIESITVEALQN